MVGQRAIDLSVCLVLLVASAWGTASVAQDGSPPGKTPGDELAGTAGAQPPGDDFDKLLDAPIQRLAQTDVVVPVFNEQVTTVARQESTVGRSPAAVYVLTSDMIRRSGARTLPDALRLVPGANVAQLNSSSWAISIRGFQNQFANKMLVQIDGRTVYTPLFGGVFWDVQDVLLEDVERIEVIRGPGATVWGANAVNGIINVITKSAKETQGIFIEAGGGNQRGFSSTRYGSRSKNLAWRVYGKWFERDAGLAMLSSPASDDWRSVRGGFRMDWTPNDRDTVTFQGDVYDGTAGRFRVGATPVPPTFVSRRSGDQRISGGNTLVRWTRKLGEKSDFSLQFYYDRTERAFRVLGNREHRDTIDLDFQHRLPFGDRHQMIWGAGYRNNSDRFRRGFQLQFIPDERKTNVYSAFVQDQMTLVSDRLFLTVGSKFSHNDFTGAEIQPTARLLYTPSQRQSLWASVSRAVRIPTRSDDDMRLLQLPINIGPMFPVFPLILGNRGFDSEELLAWEAGMRSAPTDDFFWDVAAFFNQYRKLRTGTAGLPTIDPMTGLLVIRQVIQNGASADTYGFELSGTWKVTRKWTLRGAYSYLRMDVDAGPGSFPAPATTESESPRNQFFLQSSWDLGSDWQFDLIGRYVDVVTQTPSYFELDARLAWRPTEDFEFALVGRNLLDRAHVERGGVTQLGVFPSEVRRELFGSVTWRY